MFGPDALRSRRVLAVSALVAALIGGAAAPAAAQSRIEGANGAPKFILGPGPARDCYDAAVARDASETAFADCSAALASDLPHHDRTATYVNRSILLEVRGDYAAAMADLDIAEERAPDEPAIYMNRASVSLHLEQWGDAKDAFTRALDLGAAEPYRALFGRGIAREELGDIRGAYEDYAAAAELAPEWDAPRQELARFRVSGSPGDEQAEAIPNGS